VTHRIHAREDQPVEGLRGIAGGVELRRLGRGQDADGRQRDHLGALLLERVGERRGLLAGTGHDDAAAEQRAGVEPAQVSAQSHYRTDDEQGGPIFPRARQDVAERAIHRLLLRRRRLIDERRRLLG
jgi:hypothetical protein